MKAIVHSWRSTADAFFCILFMLTFASAATAQNPRIAQVKIVSGQVSIQRGGAIVPVKVGDPLFESAD